MVQSLTFPLSRFSAWKYKDWERLVKPLLEQGLDGLEIIADTGEPIDPIPSYLLKGYQMRMPLDWLDCYLGKSERLVWSFEGAGEIADYFQTGKPEDLLKAYREDLKLALSMKAPYIVFQVSNADYEEAFTFRWKYTDEQVIDACAEILNELTRDVEPSFTLLLGNDRWPGFSFTDPAKTERLLTRVNYPKAGIMLDTGRLLTTKRRTRNQAAGIRYIHTMLDRHGELSGRILGLHFNFRSTSDWTKGEKELPVILSRPDDEKYTLLAHMRFLDYHACWTNPACVTLIDRTKPQFLTHKLDNRLGLTWSGALTRQLKAIQKGRELQARGEIQPYETQIC